MNWYLKVVRDNYANFSGRARRKEFWMFYLVNAIVCLVLALIGSLLLAKTSPFLAPIPSMLYGLAIIVPTIAVGVRRLHDVNKPGVFWLLLLVPIVQLYIVYLWIVEGDKGDNRFGPDPKQ